MSEAKRKLSRREFLQAAAAATGGVTLGLANGVQASESNAMALPARQDVKEVVIWWGVPPEDALEINPEDTDALWRQWIEQTFEEQNPGAQIKWEDHGWDEPLRTGLLTAIAGGLPPDAVIGEAFVHEFAALGAFSPINVNPEDFVRGTILGALIDGQLYGMPAFSSSFCFEVNRTVLEQSGMDPDVVPATWDELLANAQKVYEAGANGENWFGMTVWGPTPRRTYGAALRAFPWVNRTGALMGSDDGLTPSFNDPRGVAAYNLLRELYRTCDPGVALSEDEAKVGGALWDNKAAYQISATWDAKTGTDRGANSFYAPIPMYTGESAIAANTTVGNLTLSPLVNGPNPELGVAFCEFLATEEAQWQVAKIRGQVLPTRKSVLQDPTVASSPAYEGYAEKIQVMVDVMLNEELHPTPPFSCNASRIWNAWSDMIGRMFLTGATTEELLDWMQNEAETLLSDC